MSDFGHWHGSGNGWFVDGWGAGPFVITVAGKTYHFEDSDRFGPMLIDPRTNDPTNKMIPSKSPFWKAHKRWVEEGRNTIKGKKGRMFCVFSDLRKTPEVDLDA